MAEAVRVAEDRAARLGLPHVVDDRHAVLEDGLLEPLPGRRVQHLAGTEHPLEPGQVVAPRNVLAVAHEQADGRRRGEHAGHAFPLDDRPRRVGVRMIERALEGDRRRSGDQWRIDDVAVADDPTDVRGRPPRLACPQAEHPVAHRRDVDPVAAMAVDRELRLGRRAGRREDEGGIARCRVGRTGILRFTLREQVVPRQFARLRLVRVAGSRRRTTTCSTSLGPDASASSTIDRRSTSLPFRNVTSVVEDKPGAAGADPVAERARAEAGEDDAVDRADPDRRQHRDDRLGGGRHVDRQPIALAPRRDRAGRQRPVRLRGAARRT